MDEASAMELLRPHLKRTARRYIGTGKSLGFEREDLEQIAMVAGLQALRSFDASKGSLQAFARLAAERDIRHALTSATRKWGKTVGTGLGEEEDERGANDPNFALVFETIRDNEPVSSTPRMIETLKFLADGLDYHQIAKAMRVSIKTVYCYVDWCKRYLGSRTAVGIVNEAKRRGLV